MASLRNMPEYGWTPSAVAFPTNETQAQIVVRFALEYGLCLSVGGTGHDFINRHSSGDHTLFLRTSLLKGMSWSEDAKGPLLTMGAGSTFAEGHEVGGETAFSYLFSSASDRSVSVSFSV